ncbi:MAG: hypothetical protein U1F66_05730 [bacterium]
MKLKYLLFGILATSLGGGIFSNPVLAGEAGTDQGFNKKVETVKTAPLITNPEKFKAKAALPVPGAGQGPEYQSGSLMIPVRGRVSTINSPAMSCRNFNPIYSNFVYLEEGNNEEKKTLVYSIPSIQCQIDETKVTKRLSGEDGYDSAWECYANRSYCDAMWEEVGTRQIWFLKFPDS